MVTIHDFFTLWYWRLHKSYSNYFKKEVSQKDIISYLIKTDKELKATYECYQDIISSIAEKDFIKFKNIVEHQNNLVSDKMSKALKLKLYKENIKYIENSFKYDINNGIYSRMKE